MSASVSLMAAECSHCSALEEELICIACANKERVAEIREWLTRKQTVAPGLTNDEVALIQGLIYDMESE